MLEIHVELPADTKKIIEWNKVHPTFKELKERLRQCGIASGNKRWCVEVERQGEFLSPDDDDLVDGPTIRVRAARILCQTSWKRPKPDRPPTKDWSKFEEKPRKYHNRHEELFVEEVIPFVGRVFVLPKNLENVSLEDCTGTVGLVGANGESIGAFHSVRKAWRRPSKYDVYIKYMNHDKHPCFPAKIAIYNEELDLFIATPLPPFQFYSPKFLQPASGVSVGDTVHCLGFPKLINEEIRLQIQGFAGDDKSPSPSVQVALEFPAVFSGKTCFSGWKQVLADYRSFPNCSGAVIVDDSGRLKGIHITTYSATEFCPDMSELDDTENTRQNTLKRTRSVFQKVNTYFPQIIAAVERSAEAAVFLPITVIMKSLTPAMKPSIKGILYSKIHFQSIS